MQRLELTVQAPAFRSVVRLFNRDVGSLGDSQSSSAGLEFVLKDPWRVIMDTAAEGLDSLSRSLRWLRLLAQSGVDIETERLQVLAEQLTDHKASLGVVLGFVDAVFALASGRYGRAGVADVASGVLVERSASLQDALKAGEQTACVVEDCDRTDSAGHSSSAARCRRSSSRLAHSRTRC